MQNRIHEVRHINARKILMAQCNGLIKQFALKLNKKEQQCSNFLRENSPVNIGDSIARQIETTFGYPDGWLNHHVTGAESITDSDNFQTITLFAELNKIIERIGASAYNCRSDVASLITYKNTLNAVYKLKRISLSVKADMEQTALNYVGEIVGRKLQADAEIDNDINAILCDDCCFILHDLDMTLAQKTVRNLHIFRTYPKIMKVYKYTPIVVDGNYHVFIILYMERTVSGLYTAQFEQSKALSQLKSMSDANIQKSVIPPVLEGYLDDNPTFN